MAYFETLVREGTRAPLHPDLTNLRRALETYFRNFMALNHACGELGAMCVVTIGREYESFQAALNQGRFWDDESLDERLAALGPAVEAVVNSADEVRRLADIARQLPEQTRKTRAGECLLYSVNRMELIHGMIMRSAENARQRWEFRNKPTA